MPDVSVVIPTRNRLGMLKNAVDTVLTSEGVDVEVIIVDEGSSDDTPQWLAGLDDPRVKVVRHDVPVKLPGARNAGSKHATADYIAFLDDDDLFGRQKLSMQLRAIRASGAGWSYVGCVHLDESLYPVAVHRAPSAAGIADQLSRENAVPGGGSGVVVHRDVLARAGGFNESLTASEDWECWVRIAAEAPASAVDVALLGRRRHASSMSHELDRMLEAGRRVGELHPDMVAQGARADKPVGKARYMARLARESGDWKGAARVIWLERNDPGTLLRAPLYLLTPTIVWEKSFLLRRGQVKWAAPLVDELSRFRAAEPAHA